MALAFLTVCLWRGTYHIELLGAVTDKWFPLTNMHPHGSISIHSVGNQMGFCKHLALYSHTLRKRITKRNHLPFPAARVSGRVDSFAVMLGANHLNGEANLAE